MENWQLENCIKMFISTFKRNYGALSYKEIYKKFSPEIVDQEIDGVLDVMERRELLVFYDGEYHLNIK